MKLSFFLRKKLFLVIFLFVVAAALCANGQRRHRLVVCHARAPRVEPAPAVVARDHAFAVVVMGAAHEAVDDPVLYSTWMCFFFLSEFFFPPEGFRANGRVVREEMRTL